MKTKISIATILVVTVLLLAGCQSSALGIPVNNGETASTTVSLDEAQTIALEDAGFTANDVSKLRISLDTDDGRPHYDVEFRQGDYEYEYEIDAQTGKITSRTKDYEASPPATEPAATKPTEPPATKPATDNITSAKAKSIALTHAGLKESAVIGLRVTLDRDDGVTHYDVEFRKGIYEYSYEINAKTGKIIEWDKDIDD